ncbi:MAG: hypothetical protein V2A62_02980 [Candidatus Woesearchaeota archaeon]
MPVNKLPTNDVLQLRNQGLTDNLIAEELRKRGHNPQQITMALSEADSSGDMSSSFPSGPSSFPSGYGAQPSAFGQPSGFGPQPAAASNSPDDAFFERIEETVENMIDEKWDELLGEVKKIVEWKEKVEGNLSKLQGDVDKLKEDFKFLHQGVLGKLDDYDRKMTDVDTELKAVSKVFKDVVPEFVENVKQLGSITQGLKK